MQLQHRKLFNDGFRLRCDHIPIVKISNRRVFIFDHPLFESTQFIPIDRAVEGGYFYGFDDIQGRL